MTLLHNHNTNFHLARISISRHAHASTVPQAELVQRLSALASKELGCRFSFLGICLVFLNEFEYL